MSVVSKNPFDLLGDDGESSPAPAAAKPAAAAPAPAKKETPAAPRNVPGAGAARGGRYPSRGGPRNVYREGEQRNTGPTSAEGVTAGAETPGGFDGERVAPSKKFRNGPDAHSKGPRGSRPPRGPRGAGGGGGRSANFGGERRQYERRSGTIPDSQKKIEHGWGSNEGKAELSAEVEGEKDAVIEEGAETPKPEGEAEDGGWGAAEETPAAAEEATPAEPEEPEEVQKGLDAYLAERAAAALEGIGKKEGRQVNSETLEGKAFVREGLDDFFSGKEKSAQKAKKEKKEKVFIEVDGQFATPASSRPPRGDGERGRGGRGGGRGRGEGRGGPRGGRGGPRGAPRGARSGGAGGNIDGSDEKAFPALGA